MPASAAGGESTTSSTRWQTTTSAVGRTDDLDQVGGVALPRA